MKPRILAGAVTNAAPDILRAHLETMRWQDADARIDLLYIHDTSQPADGPLPVNSRYLLDEAGATIWQASPKPADASYAISDITHHWSELTFYWLAQEKQRILDHAVANGYDYVFLVDSDLLLAPGTLRSLLATEKPLVSGVFWTRWQPDSPPLPQVWQRHPYELGTALLPTHEFLRKLADNALLRVGGLGACTLISRAVLEKGVGFWPLVEGLPTGGMWQGEDRHFCVKAQRAQVELWADAWPEIFHCYRPEDAAKTHEMLATLNPAFKPATLNSNPSIKIGDLISATIEPLEEAGLVGYKHFVRGRIGTLQLAADLEDALLSMSVGEDRFVPIHFPHYHEIEAYRGQTRTMRVRLLDARTFALAPTLASNPERAAHGIAAVPAAAEVP